MKHLRTIIVFGSIAIILAFSIVYGGKKARTHVNYITAVEDHPITCWSCHLYKQKDNFLARMINEDYVSPYNLSLSRDGDQLYVVGQESNQLLVVDPHKGTVVEKIDVGNRPHTVALSRDEKTAYVSNQWSDNIFVINLEEARITDTLSGGSGPAGIAISPNEEYLYVVNSYSSDISIFDLDNYKEKRRLKAGINPVSAAFSPDGRDVYVSSRRTIPLPYGSPPVTEMTVTDARYQRVSERRMFENAYIMENVTVTPSGDLAISTLIRPKNVIPAIQVEKGWMMTHGIGIIERKEDGKMVQLLLDEPNSYYADPFDIVVSPDGKRAYVSHSGVNLISVIDLDEIRKLLEESTDEQLQSYSNHLGISSRYVIDRIPTGANPKGMALSNDGKLLYVAERLEDRIAVINTSSLETEKTVSLNGPKRITVARHGRQLFNNAGRTFQNQYACYTCHPDAHEDGLVYNMAGHDMGRNLANVQTLRDIGDIPPYKWNGKNQTIHKQDGMRFSSILTRTEAFNHKELDALVAYIITGIKNPPNLRYNPLGELTAAQQRGKEVFYRETDNFGNEIPVENRCYTCHPPPYFTNLQMTDVGTLSDTDDPMMFDVPQLNNVYESAPYLHDGRAATLEELWTKFNDEDKHGVGNDMLKDQLNDLVEYLKSIRDAKHYVEETETYQAAFSNKKRQK
ncbi:MAG: beta-propeller fold lactonase family protein [Bacteroidales bacterium]|nr:beta-propeller fold lactonase family protein [Bacteroidales bacterium]